MSEDITFYIGNNSISVNYKSISRIRFDNNKNVYVIFKGGLLTLDYPITCMVDGEKIIYAESSSLYNDIWLFVDTQSKLGNNLKFSCVGRLGETGEVFL